MLIASFIDAYGRLKLSLGMKSFMLEPAGAERCCIMPHFPPFFGTTPTPNSGGLGVVGGRKDLVSVLLCTLWLVLDR